MSAEMSGRNPTEGDGNESLVSLFCSSEDSTSFQLLDTRGRSVCLVCVGYLGSQPTRDALGWLKSFLGERFEKALGEQAESGQKGSLVAFFQSAHADLFRERAKLAKGLDQISLVAAHLREDTIEVASVGTCAAYRITQSGVERIIPSEGNGSESCYLGASVKVSVEMVKRSFTQGATYLLTSKRIDVSPGWVQDVSQALKMAETDAGCAAKLLFVTESGSFVILRGGRVPGEETSEDKTLGTDVSWYRKLREELTGAFQGQSGPKSEPSKESVLYETMASRSESGEPTRFGEPLDETLAGRVSDVAPQPDEGPLSTLKAFRVKKEKLLVVAKRAPLIALGVVVVVAIYAFWTMGGVERAARFFREARTARYQTVPARALKGSLSLASTPPGAEVTLDDSVITRRTPVSLAAVSPGSHQIAIKLGELGEWRGNVAVQPGDTATVRIAFVGEIAVSSRPEEGLSVLLDGEPKGYTPCVLESIPVGLHVVKVEGRGFGAWEEEVLVTHGGIAEVQVIPGKLPETGLVRVTAGQVSEQGYEESDGRAVFIDGRKAGATPLKIQLKPGFHSVRVTGVRNEAPSVSVVEVRPGGKHFIRAEFTGVRPVLVECTQTRVPSSGQVLVYASLSGNADAEVSRVELYLEKVDSSRAGWEPMTLLPGSHSIYAAAVPEGFASGGGQIRYFARVTTSEGLEYFSDVGALTAR